MSTDLLGAAGAARVLAVDDHEQNLALVAATLEAEGYALTLARSGTEALRAFEAGGADCVLLDVRMPGLDGFATLAKLRALPGGEDVPVVFLTAVRDLDTFNRALAAGADDFLTKPLRPAELVLRLRGLFRLRRVGEEARALGGELRQQRDALMRVSLQKERLSAFLVHDLKNPIGSIALHAQCIARDPGASEAAKASAAEIRADADRLVRLVMNLLDIARADEDALALRRARVDLATILRDVVRAHAVQAAERGVSLAFACEDASLSITVDPDLVARLAANLVENGVRHARGAVQVALRATSDGVELSVGDDGPGVPAALRERIFDKFVQVERDAGGSRQGRGLGLTFCRAVAEAHGGSIALSEGDLGATFRVALPASGERGAPAPESAAPGSSAPAPGPAL